MLVENTLFGVVDKVAYSIAQIRLHEPQDGYYVAFSGGKDSCCVLDLVKRAGVKYDAHYNMTTVDPPELVWFIRKNHPEVIVNKPNINMWDLIEKNMIFPTRTVRYCCKVFKEQGGKGRNMIVTGIRHAESPRRNKRKMFEPCQNRSGSRFLHPIIDWKTEDVWQYIHDRRLPYCSLYDEGRSRIGCVMCPFGGEKQMLKDMKRWPKIAAAYKRAGERAFAKRITEGNPSNFATAEDQFNWWIHGSGYKKEDEDMINIFGVIGDESIT